MSFEGPQHAHENPQETIRLLNEELAQTNREVLVLTLELEKRVEELRVAEQRYRRLAENAPDAIFRYELFPRRGFTFVNPQVTALTGYSPEVFYADPDLGLSIVFPDDRSLLESVYRADHPGENTVTLRWLHKNGTLLWIEQLHAFVYDDTGRLVAIEYIARDITERKHLEEQLRQSQKMEAIGRLAGGVAHDFNNLLTVINGYSAQALSALTETDPLYGEIQEIIKAGDRAASLTRQLLAFGRRQVLQPQVLELNGVVSDMDRMLRRVLGEDVELVTILAPDLESIYADRGQLEQVIMNLVVNARDAMPRGGKLTIETATVDLDEAYTQQHPLAISGRYVMLGVSDTGTGMDEGTRARIFEPFFTTKQLGEGTGLGLSMVYGIVKQSGGNIWVYSEPEKGTTFKIYLPVVTGRPQPIEPPRPAKKIVAGSETILVVEDEVSVRKFVFAILQRAGYKVLEAKSGWEALALCESYTDSIHLLITDVVMPQMGGRQLTERFASVRPDTRVLFMSGYTDNSIVQHGILDPRTPFLQKPFTPTTLSQKVREVLDKDGSGTN